MGSPQGAGTEAPKVFDFKHSEDPTLQDYHSRRCRFLLSSRPPEGGTLERLASGEEVDRISFPRKVSSPELAGGGEGRGLGADETAKFESAIAIFKKHNLQKRLCNKSL